MSRRSTATLSLSVTMPVMPMMPRLRWLVGSARLPLKQWIRPLRPAAGRCGAARGNVRRCRARLEKIRRQPEARRPSKELLSPEPDFSCWSQEVAAG